MRLPPTRITALNGPWPLHDTKASRQAEEQALLTAAPQALMEAAGLGLAKLSLALVPHARRVAVWAGPGNNGGDGWVAARHLHAQGLQVRVLQLPASSRSPADAIAAQQRALAAGVQAQAWGPGPDPEADLHIDALLGLGARQAPNVAAATAIDALNRAAALGAPVLAVDLPSGLHPDTGALLGASAVRAKATLALLTLKPGCHTAQGRDHAGDLWFDKLGASAGPPTAWLLGPPASQPRLHDSHKGSHGDVVVVGGAPGMVGAAWLAARAALAAGAGRVYLSALDPEAPLLDPGHPALMSHRQWWTSRPAILATATVVAGCGGGPAIADTLPDLLHHVPRLVLDADALNAMATDTSLLARLHQRAARGYASLLTPHPLEAARLLGWSTAAVQADRLNAAQVLAAKCLATVVLKGSGSVVASPDALPCINPTGNAALATAGTGDVLAGWLAGLWAQSPTASPAIVAQQAVWQHGRAADLHAAQAAQGAPLTAGALIDALATRPAEH